VAELVVMLASAGRRPYLARWFRRALEVNGIAGRVIVADADGLAPARSVADEFVDAPRVTDPGYADWLRRVLIGRRVDIALSVNDFELSAWSRLDADDPDFARLIRLDPSVQDLVEDKLAMASVFASAGIPVPATVCASEFTGRSDTEIVVKGRYGSGSRGLALVRAGDLDRVLERVKAEVTERDGTLPADGTVLDAIAVQPRVRGEEFGLDVVCDLDGRFATVLARRKVAMRYGETDRAVTVDPTPFLELGRRIAGLMRHRGTIDVDVIRAEDGGLWVIDVNPRFGGGYPFSHLAGADIPAAYVAWASGRPMNTDWLSAREGVTAAKYVDTAIVPVGPADTPSGSADNLWTVAGRN